MYNVLMGIQYTGMLILVLELFFITFQNTSRIQRDMFILLTSLLVTFVAYTMEMQCTDISSAMIAVKFGYLGKPFIMLAMFFLLADYCRIRLPRWFSALLVVVQTLVVFVVLTAEQHMLFYSSIDFTTEGLFPHVVLGHGPLYAVYYIGILIPYCIAMFAICFRQLRQCSTGRERRQMILFIIMIFVSLASFGIFLTNVFQGYDCTLLGYLFATIGFSISFFSFNLMDTVILAKEQAVDYIHCGLLVYDNRNRLVYQNELADLLRIGDKAAELAKSGEPYDFAGRLYSVEDRKIKKDDAIYGHMFFIQDVTERYQYEKRLEHEKQRADNASRAKTNFLFSMSHDIRTPMNAILGMTKIAGAHLDDQEKVSDCLKKIDVSGQHLLELINGILDMNKIEAGMLELSEEPFNMRDFCEEIRTMANPLVKGRKHEFITKFEPIEHSALIGDKNRLSQILMNLLSNAVKYTAEGGTIRFSVEEDTECPPREGTNGAEYVAYVFKVADNGIGMNDDFLPYLFEPFTRAEDDEVAKIQGTGLGMAITKSFVELMDGTIGVDSKPGEGSTFKVWIEFELQKGEAAPQAEQATLEDISTLDLSSKRVLLVEDNELNAQIAGEILAMTGVAVEYASDGEEAVGKLKDCEDGYYDLVFMDIQMPVMNGYDAAQAIRAIGRDYTADVPIVAMTANAFSEDVDRAIEAGMNDHIAKPLDITQLMRVIRQWM